MTTSRPCDHVTGYFRVPKSSLAVDTNGDKLFDNSAECELTTADDQACGPDYFVVQKIRHSYFISPCRLPQSFPQNKLTRHYVRVTVRGPNDHR